MLDRVILGWGEDEDELLLDVVKKHFIGGIIVFKKNIKSGFTDLIKDIKSRSKNPDLIVCVDQEGGRVQRFDDDDIFLLSPREASELLNPIEYKVMVGMMARKLAGYGIDLILAPCVDFVFDKNNILYDRTYGSLEDIKNFALSFWEGVHTAGVKTCLKHFFGYGIVDPDPHENEIMIPDNTDLEFETQFYKWAVEMGYNDLIMTAHVKFLGEIITYSYNSISYLKNNIGFKGKIITDDIMMRSAGEHLLEDKIKMSIEAGIDLCIVSGKLKDNLINQDFWDG